MRNMIPEALRLTLVISIVAFVVSAPSTDDGFLEKDERSTEVEVSPECALVLTLAGGGVGGALVWMVAGPFLSLVGFTATGVAQGSFAAWWQSTMPLISAGGLFASLQSIAMGGVATSVTIASSLGGAATAFRLRDVCDKIDGLSSESVEMKAIIESLSIIKSKIPTSWEDVGTVMDESVDRTLKMLKATSWEDVGTAMDESVDRTLKRLKAWLQKD